MLLIVKSESLKSSFLHGKLLQQWHLLWTSVQKKQINYKKNYDYFNSATVMVSPFRMEINTESEAVNNYLAAKH